MVTGLVACLTSGSGSESGTEVEIRPPQENFVCDSITKHTLANVDDDDDDNDNDFDDGSNFQTKNGLIADLYYLQKDQTKYHELEKYFTEGTHVDQISLYFNRLFVPTRPFDRGFVTNQGQTVVTPEGDTLYEWFALHMESNLVLNAEDPAGAYQMAVLSDDGTVINIDDGNGFRTLINNDGTHPTKMACATEPIFMSATNKLPVKIDYYQGPRHHISLVVMWRPWPADINDPLCGQSGNSLFFDSTKNPPEPQQPYYQLLDRGWKALTTENYVLPDNGQNPCTPPEPLVISNLDVIDRSLTGAKVVWETSRPATSMVEVTKVADGSRHDSPEDTALKTSHSVTLTGLESNTLYSIQVVSTPEEGNTAKSDARTFRTFR